MRSPDPAKRSRPQNTGQDMKLFRLPSRGRPQHRLPRWAFSTADAKTRQPRLPVPSGANPMQRHISLLVAAALGASALAPAAHAEPDVRTMSVRVTSAGLDLTTEAGAGLF